jgi:hypothetical protein
LAQRRESEVLRGHGSEELTRVNEPGFHGYRSSCET